MCIEITAEDFVTIHHELGHNYYQRAYNKQPLLFRDSANDGFHEAIGDTIALSVTPEYLVKLGLISTRRRTPRRTSACCCRRALDKVAFLPFGLLIDQWRWKVFSGEITPADYNKAWWELRQKYQGVAPAVARSETTSIRAPSTTCRRTCRTRATSSPTSCSSSSTARWPRRRAARARSHRCSIYGNKDAGQAAARHAGDGAVAARGRRRCEALTGQRQMDATAILDYFAPLKKWLDEQNKGKPVGW